MSYLKVLDLGLKKYQEVLQLQEVLFNKNITAKLNRQPTENYLLLCEHEPVFTLGKSGKRENILSSAGNINAELYHVDRGGDVTFHGPGQLVVYPILDLDSLNIGVALFIFNLEETIIESLREYGVEGKRVEGAAGVWVNAECRMRNADLYKSEIRNPKSEFKIAAIGAKVSRHVTMHGLAVNINTDLSYFSKILACGLEGKGTTSLQKELGKEIAMEDYKRKFVEVFERVFASTNCKVESTN